MKIEVVGLGNIGLPLRWNLARNIQLIKKYSGLEWEIISIWAAVLSVSTSAIKSMLVLMTFTHHLRDNLVDISKVQSRLGYSLVHRIGGAVERSDAWVCE